MKIRIIIVILCALTASFAPAQQTAKKSDQETLRRIRSLKLQRKKQAEAKIAAIAERLHPALTLSVGELQIATEIKLKRALTGARIIADNEGHTYLGTIDDEFATESIFNDYGTYGSAFSSESIWNEYGDFGGDISSESPFNKFASSPPLIVKGGKVIGRLSVSKFVDGAINPFLLKSYFQY